MCNCGCNTCETKKPALMLNESLAPRAILSEGLNHHLDANKPLTDHLYRAGSTAYFNLWAEARSYYSRGIIDISNEDDLSVLTETDLGHFGMFEGKKVPLDFPMLDEGTYEEGGEDDRKYALLKVRPENYNLMIDKLQDMNINHTRHSGTEGVIKVYTDRIPEKVLYRLTHDVWVDKFVLKEARRNNKKLNEQMDIWDDIANMEFGMDYDQLGSNEQEWVRDEIDNMEMRESLNENKINDFVDKWEDKIEKIPVIGPMISKGIDNLQDKVNILVKTAKEEAGETREAMKIVARYMKGETIGKEKNEFLKTQLKDLFKISSAALAAIGFPPAAVIGFIVAKLGLGDELFKLDDANKTTTRGKDERKSIAGKIKTFDGVKYVPYKDILPYLEKGDISLGEVKRIDEAIANILDEKKKAKKKDNRPIGKPMRSSSGGKAYKVYVKDPKTKKIKTVRFGSGGLRAKINDKEARNAFAARHKCSTKKDKTKAGYWSCRLPRYAKLLGLKSNFGGFW
jgi:hypothetical protein